MADKSIGSLPAVSAIQSTDNFVLEQGGTAKRLQGQTLWNKITEIVAGHGGISSINKTSTSGLTDTYTITFTDGTTTTFAVKNGEKGDVGDTAAVTGSSVSYQASDSGTTTPTGEWRPAPPVVASGKYLWTRTQIEFNGDSTVTTYTVARQGVNGSGAGDMLQSNYDPDSSVESAGGIAQYVADTAVTEDTVERWGFTKNAYQKPSSGIPKTDLASAVQTSLGKADSALQQQDISGKANSVSPTLSGKITLDGTIILSSSSYGDTLPTSSLATGRLFFLKV